MSPPARILPLAAVAVGGVLAFKALDAVGGVGALFPSAAAHAEEAAPRAKGASQTPSTASPPTALVKPPPPVCAPGAAELAREAGLSPAELSVIQSLSARRGQLDAREQALDAQLQLLAAAEVKVDAKLKALDAGKAQLQALLGQADAQSQAEVDRLVVVYEKMKPAEAGSLMAQLDDRVRVPVAAKMKPSVLAAVLPRMGNVEAKRLTENLARRFAAVREQVAAAQAPPPAAPEGKAAPPAVAQVASAPSTDAEGGKAERSAPVKAAPAPKRLARAAPRRTRPSKAAAGVESSPAPTATTAAAPKPASTASAPLAKTPDKPAA